MAINWIRWRYKHFHPSYLLGVLCIGILAGLVYGKAIVSVPATEFIFFALLLLLGGFRSQRWWALGVVFVAGLLVGLVQGSQTWHQYSRYAQLAGTNAILTGVISSDARTESNNRQTITLTQIHINGGSYPGDVYVGLLSDTKLKRGDKVVVNGTLRDGFASYGAAVSSATLIKTERGTNAIRDIRERFSEAVRQLVVEPMASLGLGFVVGQRSTLPDTLDEQLKVVGLTHIVVASGYNLTILVRFVMRLLARHSRYVALAVSLIMITCFVLFSGFSPSMNRAVIVTVLSLLAWYVGRRFHPLLLISYVAAGTAFVNPMYIWSDLGWYLSFFAFAGILVVAPLIIHAVYRRRKPSPFEQLVFETVSAELMALPLIAFSFSVVPVFALVANVLVAPFIPAAMALTAVTGILGMVSLNLATVVALPTTLLIGYMIAVVEWLSSMPIAQVAIDISFWLIVTWYGLLTVGCAWVAYRLAYNFRSRDRLMEM